MLGALWKICLYTRYYLGFFVQGGGGGGKSILKKIIEPYGSEKKIVLGLILKI